MKDIAFNLIENVSNSIQSIPDHQITKVVDALLEAKKRGKKILIMGMGRSGLVGKAFAMRLMHLGFNVYVVGETITPALEEGDILLAISGSGSTTFVVDAASIAKKIKAKVISFTSYPSSRLGELSDLIVNVPGRVKTTRRRDYFSNQILGEHEPLAPLGTLFEVSTTILLDSLVVELMKRLGETEESMRKRHATIE